MVWIGTIRSQTWIIVLSIALLVLLLTVLKMKGTLLFKIGFGLFRALIFFAIFYAPLANQPNLAQITLLPIIGSVLLIFGLVLNVLGTKELVKTKLGSIKGIPDKIITTGLYSFIRHPINLGFMFIFAGWYLFWSGVYSLCFLPVLIITFVIVSFYEEKNLITTFGEKYLEYKKQVGMFWPRSQARK